MNLQSNARQWVTLGTLTLILLCVTLSTHAQQQNTEVENQFIGLSLEELTNTDVTAVTGVAESWFKTPASVYVLTQDDIQRTGHQTLTELLRTVPGLNIARVTGNSWTVGARGIQGILTNSLQMLVDGRSVYDPSQFLVRWDTQDMIMDDIQKVEVMRGPGTTLWGSNAVNGVVSVTTKPASATQGWLFNTTVGTEALPIVDLRYGDKINDNMHFRIWSKYANRDAMKDVNKDDDHSNWDMFRAGFRLDNDAPDGYDWSIQGSLLHASHVGGKAYEPNPATPFVSSPVVSDVHLTSGYIYGKLERQTDNDNKWTVTASYDRLLQSTHDGFGIERDLFEIDYRHRHALNEDNLLIWGASWQYYADKTSASNLVEFSPYDSNANTVTCFIQDSMEFFDDQVALVIGSKFELNEYTGFEYHPSVRVSWTPNNDNTLWGSVSRAVRNPGRVNASARVTPIFIDTGIAAGGPPSGIIVPYTLGSEDDLESEVLIAYEMGYRTNFGPTVSLDVSAFLNQYDNLTTLSETVPGNVNNNLKGQIMGTELSIVYTPATSWRLEAGYAYSRTFFQGDTESSYEDSYPENQFHIRSYLDIGKDLEFNTALYFVDSTRNNSIGEYYRLDAGITWRLNSQTTISFVGQNLLDDQHPEFHDNNRNFEVSEVERSFYAKVKFTF